MISETKTETTTRVITDLFLSRCKPHAEDPHARPRPGFVLLFEATAAGVHAGASEIVLKFETLEDSGAVLLRRGSVTIARIGAVIEFFSPSHCDPDFVAATWYSLVPEAWIGRAH